MMRFIIGSSIQSRFLVVVIAMIILIIGVNQLKDMPLDVFPEFSPIFIEVQTEALGLSAVEVEGLITVPLEADLLNGVPWLKTIRSDSVPGLSSIVLIFEPGTNLIRARQMVQERLTQAHALPNVSKPPTMLLPLSSTSRVLKIGLSSDTLSLIDMSVLARWNIKPHLMGVPGVANVSVWGQRKQQLQVQIDPKKLKNKGVTLDQIIKTTGEALWVSPLTFLNSSTPGAGGFIDTPNQRLGIRHTSPITTPEQLAQVAVDGTNMVLGDVATVVEDHQPLIGDTIINDGKGILLVIEKYYGANTLEVTRGIESAIEALQPGLTGIKFDTEIFRPASFIEDAVDNLMLALLFGCVLIVIVLGSLLKNWRVAFISIVAIPLSLVAAGLVFYFRGDSINTMILAGLVIALGAVIDDAIIDVENIMRRLRLRKKENSDKSLANTILEASLEVRGTIVFATLIIVLAVLPVFSMDGLSGSFFQPLALSYILALLASMVVALTVTPALSMILLRNAPLSINESPLISKLQQAYESILIRTTKSQGIVLTSLIAIAVIGLISVPQLNQSLLPEFKEKDLLITWDSAAGTSREEMLRITTRVSKELRAIPGVQNVGAHMGRAVMGDKIVNINSGELWVNISSTVNYNATVAAVKNIVDGYPGLSHDVMTYLKQKTQIALSGTKAALVVRLYGHELDILRNKANEIRQTMSSVDGIVNARVDMDSDEPTIEIKVRLADAQRYGLKPGDVRRAASTILAGIEVGALFEDQKVFEVVVWGSPSTRHSITSVNELLLNTPSGEYVRLADVADVDIIPTPTVIKRESVSRHIDITANISGRDLAAVNTDVEQALSAIKFPFEYHTEILGEFKELQAAENRLMVYGVAALLGIFLLLQASFRSWRLAAIAFITLPVALVGGILATFTVGGVLTLGSLVGLLTVLGISARNGIMMINHFQHLEREENQTFGIELILRGARERLAPILLTALTTGLAILPLVILGDIPGYEIEHPMAIVIFGGLITSTLLNLFVIPALYLRFGENTVTKNEISTSQYQQDLAHDAV
ncbi:Cobalt-zinc-cadmium resistance protein CzcA; Cation efflux system protein CusA [hydrothermal vent metagenome]|uniref:Cobalt-zinc-cadmium resistance protein CzcA Cation efflux system protein CusA n=1 Tax=hydrothermal vent metagenome TaxID=652676 RepID=A0A3B1A953_9ZZZZ